MNIRHFRSIVVIVGLGWLAPSFALGQPVITNQPANQFVNASATASFRVGVTGVAPFTYQWLFDGTAIAGATTLGHGVVNAQPAQSGYYSVIVSNAYGSVTSQVAELKVFVAAPHSFSSIHAESNGSVNLSFKGETTALFAPYYDLYPLETSTNLLDWAPLVTLQRTNTALDTLLFVDTNAPEFSRRFYRTPKSVLATPLRQPTGPYPVGTFSMLLTDPSRTGTEKQFMVTFWYPAVAQAGVLPAKYEDPQVAVPGNWGNLATQVAAFFSHSLSNAALATNPAKYPVVLYDPGSSGDRRENVDKTEDLASWGYVVVGLDTKDTYISVFPNGTVVYGQTVDFSTTGTIDATIEGRVLDMQFVLDELQSLNADDPRLDGRMDLDNIGVLGYSLGGASAAQLCLRDPRCKACASMDWVFVRTNLLTQPPSFPYLFFRSDFGPDPDPAWSVVGWPDDRLEFYNALVTNAYWVKLASTTHSSFCDAVLILDSASLEAGWGWPMSGQLLPPARVSQIVRAYVLSFFNKFLKGEDDHLLDGASPAYPEVVQFLSKFSSSVAPEYPSAGLVQGSDGNFYGTTEYGGTSGNGTVFQVTTNGTLATLVSFNGTNGSHPVAALVQGSDGNFYGTTEFGGTNGNSGTVFQMTPAGVLTTLVSFNGTNGSHPAAALVQGSDGNLYGTTILGGTNNHGTIFQVTPGGALTTLVSFSGANGSSPFSPLVQGTNGNFYGTTAGGRGAWFSGVSTGYSYGTVFEVTPLGALTTRVLFTGANGYNPSAGLVQGSDGNFYGTTAYGGNISVNGGSGSGCGFGTVFKMTSAGALTRLVVFNGANGSYSVGGLVQGSDGNLYGTTDGGGTGGGGTVFKMTPAGTLTTLVSFNGADGKSPQAPLVQGSDSNFYGTTGYGGANGKGTVFQVTPAGVLTTLVSF
jgi:uncharacterized repeat protein (TIGR03803 family)